jgi:DNA-3-methyladenine glycosylase
MEVKLKREFFQRDTLTVAKELIGKELVRVTPEGITSGIIVETEAYCGPADAACHSHRGKRSGRTGIMYGPGGYAYVYLIYGMYSCLNIVTEKEEQPEAVLIRAVQPVFGIELMKARTQTQKEALLCSGPGRLCQAFEITRGDSGKDLLGDELYVKDAKEEAIVIESSPRVNVSYAGEAAFYPWRFFAAGNAFDRKAKQL